MEKFVHQYKYLKAERDQCIGNRKKKMYFQNKIVMCNILDEMIRYKKDVPR